MKNRIPRKFNRITGIVNISTSHTSPGDVIHITKNENGYLGSEYQHRETRLLFSRHAAKCRNLFNSGGGTNDTVLYFNLSRGGAF